MSAPVSASSALSHSPLHKRPAPATALLAALMVTLVPLAAQAADDAQPSTEALRATLGQRIPQLQGIDQVSPTPMSGLYEVRVGTDVFYTDATGDFLIQGELFDTQAKRNITEDRIRALTAIDYQKLPFEDAFTVVRGDGSRQIAVFEDPNCGYCKRFERDMLNLDNITVHVFLYPILSPDSFEKSRDIWCAKDTAAAWSQWMLGDTKPSAEKGSCENQDALQRNLAFGRQYKITGTPTIIFEDGTRVPGAVPAQQIEQKLQNLDKAS